MKRFLYSRWDGTHERYSLDANRALDVVSDLLMEGLTLQEALEYMRSQGFELGGLDMRVMGADELARELRQETQALYDRYRMDQAQEDPRRRLDDLLGREEQTLRESQGYESARMNDFLDRRHGPSQSLADRIERFRDYDFENPAAAEEFAALLSELDRMQKLESFLKERGSRFRGNQSADYDTAQEIRERIEALESAAEALESGDFSGIDPQQLKAMLGSDAAQSLIFLRDLNASLERSGYLREGQGGPELTPRAIRRLGSQAVASVYGALRKGREGQHETDARGVALPQPDATKPYAFGDPFDVDVVRTLLGAVRRGAAAHPGEAVPLPVPIGLDDFEIRESDYTTQTTTVLLLDMSWSMSWGGRFAAAKRVAMALDHIIRSRFPRDHFFVVGFYTRAVELSTRSLPEATWNMGDPFTNLQEGLMVAQRLIAKYPSPNPQILVVTDGQPTAYFADRELHVEWPMGFGGVSPRAAAATLREVRRVTRRGITINTFMLDDAPELIEFVGQMTRINRGRAFYSNPSQLGSYLMVDYLSRKRRTQLR